MRAVTPLADSAPLSSTLSLTICKSQFDSDLQHFVTVRLIAESNLSGLQPDVWRVAPEMVRVWSDAPVQYQNARIQQV